MKLLVHSEATLEYVAAYTWYDERSPKAAAGFEAEVERALKVIRESPARWQADSRGRRRYLLRNYPYLIIYRAEDEQIKVIAIAHGHRDREYWVQRETEWY